jgi:hypothetical protein
MADDLNKQGRKTTPVSTPTATCSVLWRRLTVL